MRLSSTSKGNTSWILDMPSELNTYNLSTLLSSTSPGNLIKVWIHCQWDISFYFNSTLVCLGLSISSPYTRVIRNLVSLSMLVKLGQREISCFKEVISSREQEYVCLSVEPVSSSLGKFMEDPWRGILVKTRPIWWPKNITIGLKCSRIFKTLSRSSQSAKWPKAIPSLMACTCHFPSLKDRGCMLAWILC